jgi:hypothetical protein
LQRAEHLPATAAEEFVRSLARHGDAILFSAAIPHQGGAGHVNEQWPDYWAELFRRAGFAVYDWLRPRVWGNEQVAWWHAQNSLLFVREGTTGEWTKRLPRAAPVGPLLRLVHPQRYLLAVSPPSQIAVEAQSKGAQSAGTPTTRPSRPYDVAVVIPTIGRPTLDRAVRSIYTQKFSGTIQVLIGIDARAAPRSLDSLVAEAPRNCAVTVFDPGYSTSVRHGGIHAARDGGALRTILSYAAHSRRVAYLDDDNWWAADHIASLVQAIAGHDWAYSLRWFVDAQTAEPLAVDRWESVGPDAGVFAARFGGFVDPSCLLIDKVACETALRLWCHPLPGDAIGMSADRTVFNHLRTQKRGVGTGRATAYYTLNATDANHPRRLEWIAEASARSVATRTL